MMMMMVMVKNKTEEREKRQSKLIVIGRYTLNYLQESTFYKNYFYNYIFNLSGHVVFLIQNIYKYNIT